MHQSNLGAFLDCTTPQPPCQFLSKTEIKNLNRLWHPWGSEKVDFFTLSDLWNCYDEWSAYGAGVPIRLDNGETLVQYYVPYLSALQIFISTQSFNSPREDADSTSETRDSFSDSFSDESESEKLSRWDGCSSEEGAFEQENLWHQSDKLGHLYCQYFEKLTPYGRVPLMDKVSELSQKYPGLMSLRSVDLSPASWMSVAWYPIYHIPMGRTIKDLSACFLTFHTLSSSFQDLDEEMGNTKSKQKKDKGIALPPFGLATYKMQGDVWVNNKNGGDHDRLNSMLSVADSWLKQLRVQHHDFNYFTGIRRG
ncbi:hypothetical protein DCAR_0521964 [Daucus carota subsp. sativus]|uniref:DUF789 domain-containing protein n=1 Tax=Daucus carota subsp. sativus TaxID=79200 RepID=A0A164ZHS3_DAUCS|nr:PREDICTED: uncharacterized protein LOC108219931 [Daucus carota subsp. sativus]XP_017249018.1 PREDICTED: uncharacterized protein LOC108219931 [Daucus carota subsp. sativus]WOH02575.1 hypothetical protein DCAR_0521964 [Daucus carota subsp. sativus]